MPPPGPARRLTAGDVMTAAFGRLEASGPQGLSLRSVADALGMVPAALYTYFPSKGALLHGMVEAVLGEVIRSMTNGDGNPRQALIDFGIASRHVLAEKPGAAGLISSVTLDGDNALQINESLLSWFARAGLELPEAARAAYALQVYVLGSVMLAAAGASAGQKPAASGADARLYPKSTATAVVAAGYDSPEQFEWGLTRVIDGLLAAAHAA